MDLQNDYTVIMEILGVNSDGLSEAGRKYPARAVDDPRLIGYFTKNKLDKIQEIGLEAIEADYGNASQWNPKLRKKFCIMGKPGKVFKKIRPDADNEQIRQYVKVWYARIAKESDSFKFHLSDSIKKYYLRDQYATMNGNLGGSCMNGSCQQSYIDFYEKYFDVRILVLRHPATELIKGRALVWSNVKATDKEEPITFMDRIYVGNDNDVLRFKDYAIEQGWAYKRSQSFSDKEGIVYDDKLDVTAGLYVTPIEELYSEGYDISFPYIDTFSYMDIDGNLSNRYDSRYYITLDSITGGHSHSGECCADCDRRIDINVEGIYVEDRGYVCDVCMDSYCCCSNCDSYIYEDRCQTIEGDVYCDSCADELPQCEECGRCTVDNYCTTKFGEIYCEDCYSDKFTSCDECGDEINRDDAKSDGADDYCEDCYTDLFFECNDCGQVFSNDERMTSTVDNEDYCDCCFNEKFRLCNSCGDEFYKEKLEDGLCQDCQEEVEPIELEIMEE